jgi:hypothetical protein
MIIMFIAYVEAISEMRFHLPQDTERRQTKHKNRKLKRLSNTDPTKNRGATSGADEG